MNTTMNRILTVCLAFVAVAAGAATQSVQRNWDFTAPASPAPSAPGGGRAVIAPGDFADGWIDSNAIFGGARGVWDLGRQGTVTLSDSNLLSNATGQRRQITVRATQWLDRGIYADFAKVAVPGADMETFNGRLTRLGTIGGWVVDETVWTVEAGVAINAVVVTAAMNGTLLDEVSVEIATSVVDPAPVLAIRQLGGEVNQVELSWSSAVSDWVVQANDNPSNAAGWQAVAEPVAVTGDLHSTVLSATGGPRFFRLSKP